MIGPRRLRVVLGLHGLQGTSLGDRDQHIATSYTQALARYHSDLIAGVSIDPSMDEPHLLRDELRGVPIVASLDSIERSQGGPLVFHSVAPTDTVMTARQFWPRWAKDPSVGFVASAPRQSCDALADSNGPVDRRRPRVVLKRLLRSADSVVTASHAATLDLISNTDVDRHRVFVAREAVPRGSVRHPKGPAQARRLLSDRIPVSSPFVLASVPHNSPDLANVIVAAYSVLDETLRKTYQLVVLTADEHQPVRDRLRQSIDELGVTGRVLVATSPEAETRRLALQACDVAVVTSKSRGDPVHPALEAMACGAVTVVADTDELRELVREAQSRFSPASRESVASILTRSLTDQAFRQAQIARGARTIVDYSLTSVAGQLLIAYEHAASTRR